MTYNCEKIVIFVYNYIVDSMGIKTKPIALRLNKNDQAKAQRIAQRAGISVNQVVKALASKMLSEIDE